MDYLSLSIAFLSGAFTAAAGNYLADKFTDARREKKEAAALKKLWKDIEARFPEIINVNKKGTDLFAGRAGCF